MSDGLQEMNDRHSTDDLLVRYLLGDGLPDAQQAEIEQRYFSDDLYFDRLLAVEDDLIDGHIRGSLSASERASFEKHFLGSKRRREKWEAQRAIASFFRSRSEPAGLVRAGMDFFRSLTLGARLLVGTSGLVLAAGVILLGWDDMAVRRNNGSLQSRVSEQRGQSAKLPVMEAFLLRSDRLRSGGGEQFQIAPHTRWVVLQVEVPQIATGFSMFAAALSTADGQEIWRQRRLPRISSLVEIDLPAAMLKRGDYVLSLSAVDGEGQVNLPAYQFRIDR